MLLLVQYLKSEIEIVYIMHIKIETTHFYHKRLQNVRTNTYLYFFKSSNQSKHQ
jgi:hypothetical protein